MNILVTSVPFAPSVGGIETVTRLLAAEFDALGHDVTVATLTPASGPEESPFRVLRRPAAGALLRAMRRADVVLQNNVSLRLGWPLALSPRRPCVIAHHVWTPRGGAAGRLKHLALRRARNVAVSAAVARTLGVACARVPNPYDAACFRTLPEIARDRELVFLGRLVSDKGLAVLLDALSVLRGDALRPRLTVIGSGPEEEACRELVRRLELESQVTFAGTQRGDALVRCLNAHRVIVVPSTWEEPFGLVALEGLACGLLPVVTDGGGLPEAIGECGAVVRRADPRALAAGIARALRDDTLRARVARLREPHLARHAPRQAALAWLDELETARIAGMDSRVRARRAAARRRSA